MNLNLTLTDATVTIDGDRVKIEAPATPELREQLKPGGRWKPEVDEMVYFVTYQGTVAVFTWRGTGEDEFHHSAGNCHPTREAAENWRDRQVLRQRLYDLRDECGGFVSDGINFAGAVFAVGIDRSVLRIMSAVPVEFGFKCEADATEFKKRAGTDYAEYFKGVQP